MAIDERPLRRDAERNRRRILDAAASVFATRGLEVSLDEIARAAGVGIGTVYRRFADREALIDALFEDRLGEIVRAAEAARAEGDAWAALVGFMERVGEAHALDRGLGEILISSAHGRERVGQMREQLRPLVDELVRRAWASGDLRADVDGRDLATVSVVLSAVADFTRAVEPEHWRRVLGLLLDGLRVRRDGPTPLARAPLDDEQLERAMTCWRADAR
jgi:AcrR family transcriptional regulator